MPDQTPEAVRLAEQRITDRIRDAEERGAERERMNGRVVKLEDHARSVNGQIEKLAAGQEEMNKHLQAISETLAVIEGVNAARLTSWQKWGLAAGGLGGIGGIVVALIGTLGGLH